MSISTARIAGAGGSALAGTTTQFRIRVDPTNTGSVFEIPWAKTAAGSVTVDWGDGTVETVPADSDGWAGSTVGGQHVLAHTYGSAGHYVVTMDRRLTFLAFGSRSHQIGLTAGLAAKMLVSVYQWGEALFPDSIWTDPDLVLLTTGNILGLFAGCSNLEGPLPPKPLSVIPANSFYGAAKLADPSPLVGASATIAGEAFAGSGVTGTDWWPASQTSVPLGCFLNAARLSSLSGLSSVTSVGNYAFAQCTSLTSLSGLSSVTSIDASAFSGCVALASLAGLSLVTSASDYAFTGCTALTSLSGLSSAVTGVGTVVLGEGCFKGCTGITTLSGFPRSANTIPARCFEGCTGLQTEGIYLPKSVAIIRHHAFANVGASKIVFGEEVNSDDSIPAGSRTVPYIIDRAAFIGQASAPSGGPRPKLIITHTSPNDIRSTPGDDADGFSFSSSNTRTVSIGLDTDAALTQWFTVGPSNNNQIPVSWAPWGVGPDWQIVTSTSPDTPHSSIICTLFTQSTGGDPFPSSLEPLRNAGTSTNPVWRTRLEVLGMVRPYQNYTTRALVDYDFSPYTDRRYGSY